MKIQDLFTFQGRVSRAYRWRVTPLGQGLARIPSAFFPREPSASRFLRGTKGSTLPLECPKSRH
jgi:hypothetical protein